MASIPGDLRQLEERFPALTQERLAVGDVQGFLSRSLSCRVVADCGAQLAAEACDFPPSQRIAVGEGSHHLEANANLTSQLHRPGADIFVGVLRRERYHLLVDSTRHV